MYGKNKSEFPHSKFRIKINRFALIVGFTSCSQILGFPTSAHPLFFSSFFLLFGVDSTRIVLVESKNFILFDYALFSASINVIFFFTSLTLQVDKHLT